MKAIALLLFVGMGADAQRLYVGIMAGTPLSQSTSSALVGTRAGSGLSTLNVRRYTLGPTAEIRVWREVSVEVNVLYKRLDRTEHRFFNPSVGNITRLTANAWEFPLLLKHSFRANSYRSFVFAGGVFRRLDTAKASDERFTGGFDPPRSVVRYETNLDLKQGGYVAGGGVRISVLGPLKITPEFRYTRWTSGTLFPTRNQVEFFLGLGL
jgi:hypothetical protein